jgi:transcriptional regulator with XRE-family HTH domain
MAGPKVRTDTRYGTWTQLRDIRDRRNLSSRELARKAGISETYMSELTNGHHWPTPATVHKLRRALRCSYDALLRPIEEYEAAS